MDVLTGAVIQAQKIKPLYDFLREDLGFEMILVSGNLVPIFEAEDSDIIAFANDLPAHKKLSEAQWEELLKKIQLSES